MARDRQKMNDYRRRALGSEPSRMIGFICECGAEDCHRAVLLRAHEFDELRAGGHEVRLAEHAGPPHGS